MKTPYRRRLVTSALAACALAPSVLAGSPAQAASTGNLDQSWGGASVTATRTNHNNGGFSVAWDVTMSVHLTDKLADQKCVYVEYKVITAHGTDADSTLATACNRETVDRATTRVVGGRMGMATPNAVEFKLCKAVWGVDPCQKTTIGF